MNSLPSNVTVRYGGEIPHDIVTSELRKNHLFFLPSHGENFGHVIHEAICAGCLILISDRTPWRNLRQTGVGWDVPLEHDEVFKKLLDSCIKMDQAEYTRMRVISQEYVTSVIARSESAVDETRELLRSLLR